MTPGDRARASGLDGVTIALLAAAILLSLLHHADHVLRAMAMGVALNIAAVVATVAMLAQGKRLRCGTQL